MDKKWHTNKTKPRAYEEFVVITKDNHDFPQVELEMIRTDDWNKNESVFNEKIIGKGEISYVKNCNGVQ